MCITKKLIITIKFFLISISLLTTPEFKWTFQESSKVHFSISTSEVQAGGLLENMMSIITMIGMGYVVAKMMITCDPKTTDMYVATAGMAIFMAGQIMKMVTYKEDNKKTENLEEAGNVQLDSLKKQKKAKEDNAKVGKTGGMLDTAAAVALGAAAGIAYMKHSSIITALTDAQAEISVAIDTAHATCQGLLMDAFKKLKTTANASCLAGSPYEECLSAFTTAGFMPTSYCVSISPMQCEINQSTLSVETAKLETTESQLANDTQIWIHIVTTSLEAIITALETVPTEPSLVNKDNILTKLTQEPRNLNQINSGVTQEPIVTYFKSSSDSLIQTSLNTCLGAIQKAQTETDAIIQRTNLLIYPEIVGCTDFNIVSKPSKNLKRQNYHYVENNSFINKYPSISLFQSLFDLGIQEFPIKLKSSSRLRDPIEDYLAFHETSSLINNRKSSLSLKEYQLFIKNYSPKQNKDLNIEKIFSFAKNYGLDLIIPESHALLDEIFDLAPGIIQAALGIAGFQAFQMDKWVSVPLGRAIGFGGMAVQAGVSAAANFMEAGKQQEEADKIGEIIKEFEKNNDENTTDNNSLNNKLASDNSLDQNYTTNKSDTTPDSSEGEKGESSTESIDGKNSTVRTSVSQNSDLAGSSINLPSKEMPLCPNPPCHSNNVQKKIEDLLKMTMPPSNSTFASTTAGQASGIIGSEVFKGGDLSKNISGATLAKLSDLQPKMKSELKKFQELVNQNRENPINFQQKEDAFLKNIEDATMKGVNKNPNQVSALASYLSGGQKIDMSSYKPKSPSNADFKLTPFNKSNFSTGNPRKKYNNYKFDQKKNTGNTQRSRRKKVSDPMDPKQIYTEDDRNIFELISKRYLNSYDFLLSN